MKEKVKKFLSNSSISISIYISLACIAIWDSTLALVIYAIIVHALLLFLVIGLYRPNVVILSDNSLLIRKVLSMIIYTSIAVAILVITEHWYILCVSVLSIFLGFVHLYDLTKGVPAK